MVALQTNMQYLIDVFEDNFAMAMDFLAVQSRWLLEILDRWLASRERLQRSTAASRRRKLRCRPPRMAAPGWSRRKGPSPDGDRDRGPGDGKGQPARPRAARFQRRSRGEGATSLLMFLNLLVLFVAYYVIRTVRDATILATGGAVAQSYASAAMAVVLLGFIPAYSWFASRVDRVRS